MFHTLLIANRGEIACRVIRTARRLGIRTIAVHSDVDHRALHVRTADDSRYIGAAPAKDSYLNAGMILEAAEQSGAAAIHPGYGFLSENADFAAACGDRGFVFVGPSPAALRAMGSKSTAKALMEKAGVPVVPGYHGDAQDGETLAAEARRIGYPVLVKASAGGGGKGMRVVESAAGLAEAAAAARREAEASFGDGRLLVEKYLARPRHVEIQILADTHGNTVHLFERDCSIQRRHQKIIEESPAPGLDDDLRRRLGAAAVTAAEAAGYHGAGTVEFLLTSDNVFYFMEMNARLQVEHPVTEMITGLDLVEWQLRVAAGQPLSFEQSDLTVNGHAIEVRLCAEDPARGFLPSVGRLERLGFPATDRSVRVDTGTRSGDHITIHYDSLIAKLIVHGDTRAAAIHRLRQALAEVRVEGIASNAAFLAVVAGHAAFRAGEVETGFIEHHQDELFSPQEPPTDRVTTNLRDNLVALACLAVLLDRQAETAGKAKGSTDPHSPWRTTKGWRSNAAHRDEIVLGCQGEILAVPVCFNGGGITLGLPGGDLAAEGRLDEFGDIVARLDGETVKAVICRHVGGLTVIVDGACQEFSLGSIASAGAHPEGESGTIGAPMPGKVVDVPVTPGSRVRRGETLMVLEAMKMEHAITAPREAIVAEVHFKIGDQVEEGAELVSLEDAE